jgi:PadR family transcriptional regulator PadR
MKNEKPDVLYGSLVLMVLRTLDTLGPQHGWGSARRIEQISGDVLELNQGTLYPALLRLEQMGWIASKWGTSDNNRRARFYALTRAGKKQLAAETKKWERTSGIIAHFLRPAGESSSLVSACSGAGSPAAFAREAWNAIWMTSSISTRKWKSPKTSVRA